MDLTPEQNRSQLADVRPGISPLSVARRCVRLDPELANALTQHCNATGETPSVVMRAALRRTLTRSSAGLVLQKESTPVEATEIPRKHDAGGQGKPGATHAPSFPASADEMPVEFPKEAISLCRALTNYGAASWKERNSRFMSVIALSQNCWQLSAEPRDAAMLRDFLALAKRYGMLQ
jgi:hypothetical protein